MKETAMRSKAICEGSPSIKVFLSDLKLIDDIISYNAPSMASSFSKKYDKVYTR